MYRYILPGLCESATVTYSVFTFPLQLGVLFPVSPWPCESSSPTYSNFTILSTLFPYCLHYVSLAFKQFSRARKARMFSLGIYFSLALFNHLRAFSAFRFGSFSFCSRFGRCVATRNRRYFNRNFRQHNCSFTFVKCKLDSTFNPYNVTSLPPFGQTSRFVRPSLTN